MKLRLHLLVLCVIIVFLVYNMANFQHRQTTLEAKSRPFETVTVSDRAAVKVSKEADNRIGYLPHGILEPYSDMELKPLWLTGKAQSQVNELLGLTKHAQEKDHLVLALYLVTPVLPYYLNDLIHGWGIDYKFGYCAQGDRTKNIGVVDSEFIVHRGVQTLGGSTRTKDGTHGKNTHPLLQKTAQVRAAGLDMRTKVRRKSRSELQDFQKRWDRAAREDRTWVDPFARSRRKRR
ncbi:hypothetical protein PR202_ga29533 [Eleusine coracana subsp. coracana]|uniref:Uncharacterized protein n=1 Tax=Eleusine coracana subsp. coracana TaxID=191504 RepID=A0AAV5DN73_ELECO|nr:hypothetical protein PR202_ga29533 [Eleusine coracana subsp. coracana]